MVFRNGRYVYYRRYIYDVNFLDTKLTSQYDSAKQASSFTITKITRPLVQNTMLVSCPISHNFAYVRYKNIPWQF